MSRFELVVFHRGASRVFELPSRGTIGVGRDVDQGVRVDDASVSRRHATIVIDGEIVTVEDDGSANGTLLVRGGGAGPPAGPNASTARNAVPVASATPLSPGDSVFAGAAVLVLRESRDPGGTAMQGLDRLIEQVAPSPIRVLLLGETGVGKEVITERIHRLSPRASKPLVKVHCAALSETLLESELFGHERGAFTGAVNARAGLFEAAHGGTLMLDELGEMNPAVQVKLLRVLEDGKVQRVGSNEQRQVDVRLISATHRDLAKDVKAGRFRQDLYFRVNGITLRVPPLRERRDEILSIATELAVRAASASGRGAPFLTESARERLLGHAWPGNVRELRQVIERAIALTTSDTLDHDAIALDEAPASNDVARPLREDLEAIERRRIEETLLACGGNQSRAAEVLGIPRRTLVERLRTWGMTKPRTKRDP